MCSGKSNLQLDSGEHDARKHAGNQNACEQAGENQEQQIVAGIDGGEHQHENADEVDDAVARELVINLICEPAKAGAPRECGNDGYGHPAGDSKRKQRGDSGDPDAPFLRSRRGKQREEKSNGERQDGDAEIAPAGAIAPMPHASDDGVLRCHRRTIEGRAWFRRFRGESLRPASDFFCVET